MIGRRDSTRRFSFRGEFKRPKRVCRQVAPYQNVRSHLHWRSRETEAMFVRRSTTERNRAKAERLRQGILIKFPEPTCGCKPQQTRGDIAMALEAGGQRFCKVVHSENGRTWTRRIHTMTVQAADGRLHHLQGRDPTDSISLYSGSACCHEGDRYGLRVDMASACPNAAGGA
jgi:hypothetical protein